MPEIIIEQNQNISNYVNMLQLPYSAALNNHMINMVSGIITAEANKTVSAIYRKLTSNRDRSTGSRFLDEYKWNNEYVDYKRINHSVHTIRKNVDENTVGFLIADDSLSKKVILQRSMVLIITILTAMVKPCDHTVSSAPITRLLITHFH